MLWAYNTPPSCDSDTTKSKMLANVTQFSIIYQQPHFVAS